MLSPGQKAVHKVSANMKLVAFALVNVVFETPEGPAFPVKYFIKFGHSFTFFILMIDKKCLEIIQVEFAFWQHFSVFLRFLFFLHLFFLIRLFLLLHFFFLLRLFSIRFFTFILFSSCRCGCRLGFFNFQIKIWHDLLIAKMNISKSQAKIVSI